jgi:UTP--glucose-1-phosphate uridylyltransferase
MPGTPIRKAVIPVAGFGTRMLPAAKAVPKEMLPILDRPTIQHVVEEAVAGGISDVLFITSRQKQAIEDHFNRNPELEDRLRGTDRSDLLASVDELMAKVTFYSVIQPLQRGLGDAVHQARSHVGSDPFLCMLGDTVFHGDLTPAKQLIDAYATLGTVVIGLEEVAIEKVSRYGIVSGKDLGGGVFRLDGLIEKPSPQEAPSRFAIAARYILTPGIFDCLDRTPPGRGGEVQLTDALRLVLDRGEPIHGVVLKSKRHDVGNLLDWLKTNLTFASRDQSLWHQLRPMLESLLREHHTY